MEFNEHSRLSDGFRIRPDGAGGLAYIKVGNEMLRAIPRSERMLEVVCRAAGSRKGPRLVAVVTHDWQLQVVNNARVLDAPGHVFTQCRCGPEGHSLSLARVVKMVDLLSHRPSKARRVDAADLT